MNRILKLNILNTMYYKRKPLSLEEVIASLSKEAAGFDVAIKFSFSLKDETLELVQIDSGIHQGPISLEPDKREENALTIDGGEYCFMQAPIVDANKIKLELLPFLGAEKEGVLFIRIFKENLFEEVLQFLRPLP